MLKVLFFVIAFAMQVFGEDTEHNLAIYESLHKHCGNESNYNAMMIPLQKKFPPLTLAAGSSTFNQSVFTVDSLNPAFPNLQKLFSSDAINSTNGTCSEEYARSCTVELLPIYKECYAGQEKATSCLKKHVNDIYNKDEKLESPENSKMCKWLEDLSKCLDSVFQECLQRQTDDKLWKEALKNFGPYLSCASNVSTNDLCKAKSQSDVVPTTTVASDSNVEAKSSTDVVPTTPIVSNSNVEEKSSTDVVPTTTVASNSSTQVQSNASQSENQKQSNAYLLISLVCAFTLIVVIIGTSLYFCYFKKRGANAHD